MRLLKGLIRNEKGFTLIEVITVVAILGAIMGVMAMTVVTIMRVSPQNNDHAIALSQVQNAGYWIARDAQMAEGIYYYLIPPSFLYLTWTEWTFDGGEGSPTYHTIIYKLEMMSGNTKKLMREHWQNETLQGRILIAEYIYYNPFFDPGNSTKVINYQNDILTLKITATSGEVMATKEYQASRRPTF